MNKLQFKRLSSPLLGLLLLLAVPGQLLAQASASPAAAEGPMLTQPAVIGMLALLFAIVVGSLLVRVSRVATPVRDAPGPYRGAGTEKAVQRPTPQSYSTIHGSSPPAHPILKCRPSRVSH